MPAPLPLTQLGRYRIVQVLGRGAMGVVYEGLDPRLGRAVAIKTILKSHLMDSTLADEYSARFEREAQAAARLNHPHIVTVFDFGEQDEVAYLVMEFIRGRELAQAFAAGERFELGAALRITAELLEALAYAHAQGVVHRDVKPANVMLDAGGRVKLTDFGVARLADAGHDRTAPGTMVGTPSYMSPEQIQGLPVGSRADIFAVGIVLYQFLTGARPFVGGGPFAIQKQIVHDEPLPPSRHNPALPALLDAIVARALAKRPEDRYESADAFAAALRALLAPETPGAPEATVATVAPGLPAPADPDATVLRPPTQTRPLSMAARTAALPPAAAPVPAPVLSTEPRPEPRPRPEPVLPPRQPAPVRKPAPAPRRRMVLGLGAAAAAAALGLGAWWLLAARPATPTAPAAPAAGSVAPALPPPVAERAASVPAISGPASAAPAAVAPPSLASSVASPAASSAASPAASSATLTVEKRPATAVPARRKPAPAPAPRPDARCSDLLVRQQLGEPLSAANRAYFERSCKQ